MLSNYWTPHLHLFVIILIVGDDMLKEGFIICENEIKNQILRDIKGFVALGG